MLDLLTLEKTRNWLRVSQDKISKLEHFEGKIQQIRLLATLIRELDEKINAIKKEKEIHPPENGIMLVRETRGQKEYYCTTCGINHSVYKIFFSTVHVAILRKVFAYCVQNKTHLIEKKNIPGLTHTDYGNFYALRRFGFLYWFEDDGKKVKGGKWGVAVKRIYAFLRGEWKVAEYAEMNTATKEGNKSENRIYIGEIPRYRELERDNITGIPYFVSYEQNKDLFIDNI